MQSGIGLPNTLPGIQGRTLLDWARRADERGFSTLGTIGRVVYPAYEELIALTAAAAVTQRIGLLPGILLAPTRDPVLLAKEAASLDQISGGRFTLGIGVGGREDDYIAVQRNMHDRGKRLDEAVALMRQAWAGEPVAGGSKPIGPRPVSPDGVPIIFGGNSDQTIERVVRYGVGWISGGGGPQPAGAFGARVREAWKAAGKPGAPRIVGLQYYALGPDAARGADYLLDYYAFAGPWVARMAEGLPKTPEVIRDLRQQFEDAGVDEVIFSPTIPDVAQVDLLADVVLG